MRYAPLIALLLLTATLDAAPPWPEILAPSRATPAIIHTDQPFSALVKGGPKAQNVTTPVLWRADLRAALTDAQQRNMPLFVTLRSLPCKQCADFDKDVLEGGPLLTPLLQQFVTVRVTDTSGVDLRLLPMHDFQDMDLSWWGYFLAPDGRLYGVFGGKDSVGESTRISAPALANTMKRVLAHHFDPRRIAWNIDGPAPDLTGEAPTPLKLSGYDRWLAQTFPDPNRSCLHCHHVAEVMRQPAIDAHTFDKQRDTQVWPLPENVGILLDHDDGLLITRITPGSPADLAGLRAGDSLGAANGRRLLGQADFRGVLHRLASDQLEIIYLRNSNPTNATLTLPSGWRKTDLGWRMSMSQGNIGVGPGFFPLQAGNSDRMSLQVFWGAKTVDCAAARAGLQKTDTIIAVDGQSPPLAGRAFLTWFRMNHEPGDEVTLTLRDAAGQTRDIKYRAEKQW
jgi:hypothetical protein